MILKNLLNVLFPPLCLGCKSYLPDKSNWSDRSDWPLCDACFKTIPINSGFYCPLCNRRLPEPKNLCHPQIKYVLAAASSYLNPVLKELIHSFKYQNIKSAVKPIESLLNLYLEKIIGNLESEIKNPVIIPVPLHAKKERKRGFNQAFLIAQTAAVTLCYSIAPETNNLVRIKNTESQTKIVDYAKRKTNIAGAFKLNFPEKIKGKDIILVDDVFTSGATMNEAARLLKEAGAKKIIGLVIAKV